MTDTDKLKRLAEAATKGVRFWSRDKSNQPTNLMTSGAAYYILSAQADISDYGLSVDPWLDASDDDLDFIAAANPQAILALIAERNEAVALLREIGIFSGDVDTVSAFLARIDAANKPVA